MTCWSGTRSTATPTSTGVVNAADYTRLDAGIVQHLTGWLNGDFNYDGAVDGSDYALADNGFNRQAGGIASPAAVVAVAVPEPASIGLVCAAVAVLARRRGRPLPRRETFRRRVATMPA